MINHSLEVVSAVKAPDVYATAADWKSQAFLHATALTSRYFGDRVRNLFAPIYVRNHCVNDCQYCGYRKGNRSLPRDQLSPSEARAEAKHLVEHGVRRVLVLAGELPERHFIDHFCRCVEAIRSLPGIEWIGIEVAPVSKKACTCLVRAGADAFIVFQESYDRATYRAVHPDGDPKSDFDLRYDSVFVAADAGFREIGLGVLYGLSPSPEQETSAMVAHAQQVLSTSGVDSVRLSFPRFRPSKGAALTSAPYPSLECDLLRNLLDVRLQLPSARLVLTARERREFRLRCLQIVTDFGAGGSTSVGGYASRCSSDDSEQFLLLDRASAADFVHDAAKAGYSLR